MKSWSGELVKRRSAKVVSDIIFKEQSCFSKRYFLFKVFELHLVMVLILLPSFS
jgi:hypothetical protein